MTCELLSTATRVARKPHHCIWCWQSIAKGETYVHEASVNYGDFQNHHFHPECCDAMHEAAREEGGPIEWTPGIERPLTAAEIEYQSWNPVVLLQARLL